MGITLPATESKADVSRITLRIVAKEALRLEFKRLGIDLGVMKHLPRISSSVSR